MRTNQEDGVLVPGVHRAIRSLAPGEGPWPGTLVTDGTEVGVWCDLDRADLGIDWRFAGAAHVAAPTDVARSAGGHGAILPWCTTRVTTFLARRTAAEAPLEPGEWGTLVLSMLRGLREIVDSGEPELAGQWWLTEAGRPLCVPGGSATARSTAVDILACAQTMCPDRSLRRILVGIQESVADSIPTTARVRGWERELLEFAAPRALRVDDHAPQSARDASIVRSAEARAPSPRRRMRSRTAPVRSLLAERLVRAAAVIPRRRPRRAAPARPGGAKQHAPRRRMLLIAGGAAAAVLCAGALWPGDEHAPSQAAESALVGGASPAAVTPGPTASAAPSSSADPEAATDAAPPAAADPAATAVAVLAQLDACAAVADEECSDAIASGSSARSSHVLRSESAGEPVLVDDYGDLAVIRLGVDAEREQMLVLVRQNDEWLVRDVYDVADQPGDG